MRQNAWVASVGDDHCRGISMTSVLGNTVEVYPGRCSSISEIPLTTRLKAPGGLPPIWLPGKPLTLVPGLAISKSFAHGIIIFDHNGCLGLGKNAIFRSLAPAGVTSTDAPKAKAAAKTTRAEKVEKVAKEARAEKLERTSEEASISGLRKRHQTAVRSALPSTTKVKDAADAVSITYCEC